MIFGFFACLVGLGLGWLLQCFIFEKPISWWKAALISTAVLICAALSDAIGSIPSCLAAGTYITLCKKEEYYEPFFAPFRVFVSVLRWTVNAPSKVLNGLKSRSNKPKGSDLDLYEKVSNELAAGEINSGLMLKAEIESGGDSAKARVLYAEWRIQELKKSPNDH